MKIQTLNMQWVMLPTTTTQMSETGTSFKLGKQIVMCRTIQNLVKMD